MGQVEGGAETGRQVGPRGRWKQREGSKQKKEDEDRPGTRQRSGGSPRSTGRSGLRNLEK